MTPEQRTRIVDKHRDSLKRHGYHPHALYWSGKDIQELRFQIIADMGINANDSVLDVGCGFGDLYRWANRQGMPLDYTGLDLSPDLLAEAQQQHPNARFIHGDIFDAPYEEQSMDWVVLSGALNEELHDDSDYAKRVIARMYGLCRRGVAFNMLDARFVQAHDLHSQYPDTMLAYAQSLCPNCVCHDDYLKNDFTIYMYREALNNA